MRIWTKPISNSFSNNSAWEQPAIVPAVLRARTGLPSTALVLRAVSLPAVFVLRHSGRACVILPSVFPSFTLMLFSILSLFLSGNDTI